MGGGGRGAQRRRALAVAAERKLWFERRVASGVEGGG